MRGRVFKRFRNSWTIVISLDRDPVSGKRRQKWVTVRGNKDKAEKKLTELLYQLDGGANLDPEKITLADYLTLWLSDIKSRVSPRTYDRYEGIVQNHLVPSIGNILLELLNRKDLERHYKECLAKGLNPRTVSYHHAVIHHALKDAVTKELINRNVADAARPPHYNEPEMQTWDRDELNQFLLSVQHHTLYALFYLALFCGMRRSELLGLQWHDIDFEYSQLSVRRALHHLRDGRYIFTQPKSEKSRRTIALSPSTIEVLESHHQKKQTGQGAQVFPNLNPNTVTWEWKKACITAGVRPIRLHDARHTHASLLLQQGVHPKIVQERLGHSSIEITMDTYSHVMPGLQEQAAKRFDDLVEADL